MEIAPPMHGKALGDLLQLQMEPGVEESALLRKIHNWRMKKPMVPLSPNGLTPKQDRFKEEYLKDLNGTQAAIRAGFSPKTAYSIGSELLKKPEIQDALTRRWEEIQRTSDIMSAEEVLEELTRIARARMSTYVTWGPGGISLKSTDELPEEAYAAVAEIIETAGKEGPNMGALRDSYS